MGAASESYDNAWGWADTRCGNKMVFICRVIRGWLRGRLRLPALVAAVRAGAGGRAVNARRRCAIGMLAGPQPVWCCLLLCARCSAVSEQARPVPVCCTAAEGALVPPFYDATSGNQFLLKLALSSYEEAETCCNKVCAHLASYTNQQEQAEVSCALLPRLGRCQRAHQGRLLTCSCCSALCCHRLHLSWCLASPRFPGGELLRRPRLPAAQLPQVLLAGGTGQRSLAQLHLGKPGS